MNSDIQTDLDASETNDPIREMIKPLAVAKYTKYYRKQKWPLASSATLKGLKDCKEM